MTDQAPPALWSIHAEPADSPANPVDLETLNARLLELDELKTSFVALVSHELRTPVNLVNGFLQIGLEQLGESVPPETREYFEIARDQAARLARIVQELTDFARLQRDRPVELTDPISLDEAILQVLTLLRPALESKSLVPSVDLPADIAALQYDGESLIIIFRNLLSNAAKFTPAGGRVWVTGTHIPTQDMVAIAVNDTASLIPPEKQETIFEDFRQLENHLTRRYEGMGLGLAVARRTARVLGGDIVLNVRTDGNTFTVMLPVAR